MRTYSTGVFLMTVLGFVLYGSLVLLPIMLQTLLGYPSLQAGIAMAPRGMGSFLAMPWSACWWPRWIRGKLLALGLCGGALTLYWLGNLSLSAGYWDIFWPQFIQGMSLGLIFVPLTTISMDPIPKEAMGNATSLFNLMRNIGGSVGIAAVHDHAHRAPRAGQHQPSLGAHITVYDPQARAFLEGLRAAAGGARRGPGHRHPAGPRHGLRAGGAAGDDARLRRRLPDPGPHLHPDAAAAPPHAPAAAPPRGRGHALTAGPRRPLAPLRHGRRVVAVRLSLAAALVLAAVTPAAADLAEAKARGRLEVLFVPGSPEFVDVEKHSGFDMEILEGFARLHRLDVAWVPVKSWDLLLSTLNDGAGDLAAGGITTTPAREKIVRFTTDVFPSRHVMVTPAAPSCRADRRRAARGEGRDHPGHQHRGSGGPGACAALQHRRHLRVGRPARRAQGRQDHRHRPRRRGCAGRAARRLGSPAGRLPRPAAGARLRLAQRDDSAARAALDEYIANLRRTPSWNRLVVKYFGDVALEILRNVQKE